MARVLIVDDEPALIALERFVLEHAGHEVFSAANGAEALAALGVDPENPDATLPDVILLDVMMPVLDGLATAEALRDAPRVGAVPILVVTAKGDIRALFEAMPQVAGFFQKPFAPKDLREAVARAASAK